MGSDFGNMSCLLRHRQSVQYIHSRNIGHSMKTIKQIANINPYSCQAGRTKIEISISLMFYKAKHLFIFSLEAIIRVDT